MTEMNRRLCPARPLFIEAVGIKKVIASQLCRKALSELRTCTWYLIGDYMLSNEIKGTLLPTVAACEYRLRAMELGFVGD
ncbi:hypothetical protein CTI12_AA328050 [Artemisia annua]|uniref:Uncharacterized protein n=1 Tax=Artemisia annua TaxID=35608 RepID=A0A2U1MYN8_ARTAN|nr:hypothetical protein CTI12_AA328050 [Artemisia annua]